MQTYLIKCVTYAFFEDKFYPLYNIVEAENEDKAYSIALENTFEIETKNNIEAFPSIVWFREIPYFDYESLIIEAKKIFNKDVFLQTRNKEWFIYQDLNEPPLEKVEITEI